MDGVARIRDGVVVNVEAAEPEWVRAAQLTKDDHELIVEYTEDAPAYIGLQYDPARGFEQPPKAMLDDQDPPDYLYDDDGHIRHHPTEWRQPKGNTDE